MSYMQQRPYDRRERTKRGGCWNTYQANQSEPQSEPQKRWKEFKLF